MQHSKAFVRMIKSDIVVPALSLLKKLSFQSNVSGLVAYWQTL